MEIKDMRAFYAIVEEGNISHAAQRLDIAQPALSRQMKRLETSLGVQLFERGSRRIRLTDAGKVMYARVEHILGIVDGAVREITEMGSGVAGAVRLGTITTSGAMLVPELLSEFHRRYPQVTYQIWEAEGARILELLDNRVIEIGITRTQVDAKVYESIVLPNEPLVVIMNREQEIGDFQRYVRMWLTYHGIWDKIMYGSDWPLVNIPDNIRNLGKIVPEEHWGEFYYDNALRVYSRIKIIKTVTGS